MTTNLRRPTYKNKKPRINRINFENSDNNSKYFYLFIF